MFIAYMTLTNCVLRRAALKSRDSEIPPTGKLNTLKKTEKSLTNLQRLCYSVYGNRLSVFSYQLQEGSVRRRETPKQNTS